MTPKYTYLSLTQLDDCLSDISGWMTNNRLRFNADKTYFTIIGTSRQGSKLTRFFPMPILDHSISLYIILVLPLTLIIAAHCT